MSFPPAGTCLVHQTSGDSVHGNSLRGALPSTASLSPQPKQLYNNGTQSLNMSPAGSDCSTALGGTIDSVVNGMNLLGANGTYTMDPGGANETSIPLAAETPPAWARPNEIVVIPRNQPPLIRLHGEQEGGEKGAPIPLAAEPPPAWARPNEIVVIPRNQPLNLTFTPGDAASPTAILIYSYAAATNSTVEVECLAAAGASSFTISADSLANLPLTYAIADGSYTNLTIGSLGMNSAVVFHNGLAANGIVLVSSWLGQTVVIQ